MMKRRKSLLLAIPAMIVAGVGAAILLAPRAPVELRSGTALAEPRRIADFELLDQRGQAFRRDALEGRWSLLFTGFTHCPDICPTTLATMAELGERLGDAAPQLLFVSVDPERDTPERLAAYLGHFGPDLVGATGSRERIEAFTRGLGLAQVRNPGAGGEYTVDHSAALVLIDPRARLAGYFQPPHDLDALAADLAALPPG